MNHRGLLQFAWTRYRKLDLYIAAFQEITRINSNFAIAPAELGTASSILVRKRIQCPYLCGQFFNELLALIPASVFNDDAIVLKISRRGTAWQNEVAIAVGEFARLIRESHRELFGFIFAMLQNRADAEDVYQQTALMLWKKFAEFMPGTNFTGWAIRVATVRDQGLRQGPVAVERCFLTTRSSTPSPLRTKQSRMTSVPNGWRRSRTAWKSLTTVIDECSSNATR